MAIAATDGAAIEATVAIGVLIEDIDIIIVVAAASISAVSITLTAMALVIADGCIVEPCVPAARTGGTGSKTASTKAGWN